MHFAVFQCDILCLSMLYSVQINTWFDKNVICFVLSYTIQPCILCLGTLYSVSMCHTQFQCDILCLSILYIVSMYYALFQYLKLCFSLTYSVSVQYTLFKYDILYSGCYALFRKRMRRNSKEYSSLNPRKTVPPNLKLEIRASSENWK